MEFAGDGNDRVARNLFELGLEHFISIPAYVLQYVSFLEGLADITNARALFERALGETAPADAGPLWDRYIKVRAPSSFAFWKFEHSSPKPNWQNARDSKDNAKLMYMGPGSSRGLHREQDVSCSQ